MTKVGLIQTSSYKTNQEGISDVCEILREMGRKETQIVCLPEQWLPNNEIRDFDLEFSDFKKVAKEHSMTIIPGAFYSRIGQKTSIITPVIGPQGEIIGTQRKIHPFDYERDTVEPGKKAKIFDTACKFGVIICYDMVFPNVANTLSKKGAKILFSPSRIVRRGVEPWHLYVQVRSLENRIPIIAANVEDKKFGGSSVMVDLVENDKVMLPKITKLTGEGYQIKEFDLKKYQDSRKDRFRDSNSFE